MTPAAFLKLALSLPEAALSSHMGHADIRVGGKIFASPADRPGGLAVLKLRPDQQQMLCEAEPGAFVAVKGGWGAKGWTYLKAGACDAATARSALWMAWRNTASKSLQKAHQP